MSDDANRTIRVGVDASQAKQGAAEATQAGVDLFETVKQKAESYSDKLSEQSRRIEQLLKQEERLKQSMFEQKRLAIEIATQEKLAAIDKSDEDAERRKTELIEKRKRALQELNTEKDKSKITTEKANELFLKSGQGKEAYAGGAGIGQYAKGAAGRAGGIATGLAQGAGIYAVLAGIPYIGQTMSGLIRLSEEREKAQGRMYGATGRTAGFGAAAYLGMTTTELANYATQQSQAQNKRLTTGEAVGQFATEKAFSLQQGAMTAVERFRRMGAAGSEGLMMDFLKKAAGSKLWEVDKADFSGIGGKVQDMSTIMQREMEVGEQITPGRTAGVMARMGRVGGKMESMTGQMFSMLDQAIKGGGGNEFMRAEIMSAISQENPNASLYQVRQTMAQGMMNPTTLAAVLERGQKKFGQGSELTKAFIAELLPQLRGDEATLQRLASARAVQMLRELPPEASVEEVQKALANFGKTKEGKPLQTTIRGRAGATTSRIEKVNVSLEEAAAELGVKMSALAAPAMEKFSGEVIKFAQKPGDYLGKLLEDTAKHIRHHLHQAKKNAKEIAKAFTTEDQPKAVRAGYRAGVITSLKAVAPGGWSPTAAVFQTIGLYSDIYHGAKHTIGYYSGRFKNYVTGEDAPAPTHTPD